MTRRIFIAAAALLAGSLYLARVSTGEVMPTRESLSSCPVELSAWSGRRAPDFDERTLAVLGADEYLNRVYRHKSGSIVGLYIGYYGSQRQGDTIHSPLNCLPGAGWSPVRFDRIAVPVSGAQSGGAIRVNRYVIQKGLDRQLVLYWYQSHGRVVASEYWSRLYMVIDAMRTNRTDGALVRVISPIADSETAAELVAVDFVQTLFPLLGRYLPS